MSSGVILTCCKYIKLFSNGWEDRTSEVSPLNNPAMIHVLQYLSIIEQIKDRLEAVSLNFLQICYVFSILHLFPSFNYSLHQRGLCQLFIINCPWRYGRKPLLRYLEVQNHFQFWKQINNQMWGFIPSCHKWKRLQVVAAVQCDLIIIDPCAGIP